jgi:rhodanese-related sulfurtransferase
VARALIDRGFRLVRPLAGGLDAWVDAGYLVEPDIVAVRAADGESIA